MHTPGQDVCVGIYRGIVADTADQQERRRYRVRVINIHRDDVPVEALPWAEWCVFGGKGFGDFPSLQVGDAVFIMFEQGSRRFPVIVGGWLSYQGGTNDLPNELAGDYEANSKRWMRVDRAGNKVTLSGVEDELWVEIQSGKAKITVRQLDGSVSITSDVSTRISSPQVQVQDADDVTVQSKRVVASVTEEATIQCDGVVNIQAAETVNIGQYQPPTVGVPPPPKTSATVDVEATTLVKIQSGANLDVDAAGQADIDAIGDVNVHSAANLNITGDAKVAIKSTGPVEITARDLTVTTDTAKLTIEVQTDVEINAGGNVLLRAAADVDIEATGGDVSVRSGGATSVEAAGDCSVDAAGNVEVNAAGVAHLESASKVEIVAPVIEIDASSLLSLSSDGTARLDGTTILIG